MSIANGSNSTSGVDGNTQQQRQQAVQQQQNAAAQLMTNEKIKNTLLLLANGFSRLSAPLSSFNYVRGAASSLAASAGSKVNGGGGGGSPNVGMTSPISTMSSSHHASLTTSMDDSSLSSKGLSNQHDPGHKRSGSASSGSVVAMSTSGSVINREVRIGVTYAYVELANLLGSQWLERNLPLYLTHVLCLVNNTKAVSTHLDAVYSRKCVQFILRSVIGGMLNEKVQLQAARELVIIIDKCINGFDLNESGLDFFFFFLPFIRKLPN